MSESDQILECYRCGTAHSSPVAVFSCPACARMICDACKNEHKCAEIYCGHCDEMTTHSTNNCVLPIVN
jgi:hypothetical protein